jgi:uncharacterized protein (TIGR03000 family)
MQSRNMAMGRRRRTMTVGAALVLLSLAGTGRAQLEYNGGWVQTHRADRGDGLHLAAPPRSVRFPTSTPPSFFPDHDFYYPFYYPALTALSRSSAGEAAGRPALPPVDLVRFGVSAAALPWNQIGFKEYDEPLETMGSTFRKYDLATNSLSQASLTARSSSAVLIAHLPEHAAFWVEGTRTRSEGRTRYFQSPPLRPDRKYNYRVRAAWIENGRWTIQTRMVPVQAGTVQAVYLRPSYDSSK